MSVSDDLVRVRILQRGQVLGEEAVASSRIEAGTAVIDEAPLLVLPHTDVAPTTAAASSSAAEQQLLAVSPAAQLKSTLEKHCNHHLQKKEDKNEDDDDDSLLWKAAAHSFSTTVQPALEKTERIALEHNLSPGYFAPLVMAHYTMTREEGKEIVRVLISHVEDEDGAPQEMMKKRANFGFEPLRLVDREVAAGEAVVKSLSDILLLSSPPGADSSSSPSCPAAEWWTTEVFAGDDDKKQQQKKKQQQNSSIIVRRLLKWLHGVRINVHSDDVHKLTAVFRHACKFNHSCKPNTFWYLSSSVSSSLQEERALAAGVAAQRAAAQAGTKGVVFPQLRAALKQLIGNAVHVASRDIDKDEPTTFSYIGCGLNLLAPAMQRRHSLSHLHFVCACQRCADYDRGAKPEVALRGVICGECFGRATKSRAPGTPPPPLSDFLSVVQLPLNGGCSWMCATCGYEPVYEDLTESMMHEAVHVDMLMSRFFQKKAVATNGAGGDDAGGGANIKPLGELWGCLQQVARQLTTRHYISAVGFSSFVSQMVGQLRVGATDFEHIKKDVFSSQQASTAFVTGITQTMVWFASTMKGTPQHARFQVALVYLVDAMVAKQKKKSSDCFLSADDVASIGSLVAGFAKSSSYERLRKYPDMNM